LLWRGGGELTGTLVIRELVAGAIEYAAPGDGEVAAMAASVLASDEADDPEGWGSALTDVE